MVEPKNNNISRMISFIDSYTLKPELDKNTSIKII